MKIGIYALAKNEAGNVPAWEASSHDADVRVVTDTGSTDHTVELLQAAGVTVARGSVVPWRWDDAHNLSLHHLPTDVDVAIRLDLDEVLVPGWREILERAWTPGETTQLRYVYEWSSQVRFHSDRIHARSGYRWCGATHEGLVRWAAAEVESWTNETLIRHRRDPGKSHSTDLWLLERAVAETPHDTRMRWYLARELDYAGRSDDAAAAFERYLERPDGAATERAYARRVLARLRPKTAIRQWIAAQLEADTEPEAFLLCAESAQALGDPVAALHFARQAAACPATSQTHASDPRAYGSDPADLAGELAWSLGLHDEALDHFREAARRAPHDERIARNVTYLQNILQEPGPRAFPHASRRD